MAWIETIESAAAQEELRKHQDLARAVWKSGSGLSEIQRHMIFLVVSTLNGCHH
jgi:alkylhydroperoxidase family enzyme